MKAVAKAKVRPLGLLLRGDPEFLRLCVAEWDARLVTMCVGTILLGAGLYGAAMGCWRAPLQAVFVAVKFPLILLLTCIGNALLNGMVAPLLGLNITLRQSFLAILLSFTVACCILGSFSPLVAFVVWNAPPLTLGAGLSTGTYSFIQLMHVGVIAFAGIIANLRLVQLLSQLSGDRAIARRVLLSWLAGNLFLGSQLSWILRPFIGAPGLQVEFLRATAFKGNFYETVFGAVLRLLHGH